MDVAGSALIVAAYGFWLLLAASAVVSRALLRRAAPGRDGAWPDVSVIRPLCGTNDALAANLRSLRAVDYRGRLEVICVAASADDPAWHVVDAVEPEADGPVWRRVVAGEAPGWLPKTWSLHCGLAVARYEHVVFADADARLDADVFRDVVAASCTSGTAAAYAHPVVAMPSGIGGWLEAAVVNYTTLVVQPILARLGVDHLAGTLWATRRSVLDRAGGFAAVADNIGDDVTIGRLLRRAAGRLAFVARPVVTVQGRMRVADFARHQIRWLRTWRSLGGPTWPLSLVFSSVLLAAIGVTLDPVLGPVILPLVVAEMGLMGWVESRLNGRRADPRLMLLAPSALAVEQVLAIVALCGRAVEWGGWRFVLGRAGRIVSARRVDRVVLAQGATISTALCAPPRGSRALCPRRHT